MFNHDGCIIWLTGLPALGKTTLGKRLTDVFRKKGYKVELLDGDEIRVYLDLHAAKALEPEPGNERLAD